MRILYEDDIHADDLIRCPQCQHENLRSSIIPVASGNQPIQSAY